MSSARLLKRAIDIDLEHKTGVYAENIENAGFHFLLTKRRRFVARLEGQLIAAGYEVRIDRKDIAPSEIWRARLDDMIVNSDVVVFVVSPDSIRSAECEKEVNRTIELGKRLAPLLWRTIRAEEAPEALRDRNWIQVRLQPRSKKLDKRSMSDLRAAIDTDIGWIREQARLSELAIHWQRHASPRDQLLRGVELEAALNWREAAPGAT